MAVRAVAKPETETGGIAADRLRSIVERTERLGFRVCAEVPLMEKAKV